MLIFGNYNGIDVIGWENKNTGKMGDVFAIVDMPRSDGQSIFLFPSVRPIRSTMFCIDINGNRIKFDIPLNEIKDIKTEQQMSLIDKEIVEYIKQEYKRVTGMIINF